MPKANTLIKIKMKIQIKIDDLIMEMEECEVYADNAQDELHSCEHRIDEIRAEIKLLEFMKGMDND